MQPDETSTDLKETFGQRLRIARRAQGYKTAKAFAEKLDMEQNNYSPYESRSYIPKIAVLGKIRLYLKVTTDYLFFGDESGLSVETYEKIKAVQNKDTIK